MSSRVQRTLRWAGLFLLLAGCEQRASFVDVAVEDVQPDRGTTDANPLDVRDVAVVDTADVPVGDAFDASLDAPDTADVAVDAPRDAVDVAIDVRADVAPDAPADVVSDTPADAGPSGRCTPTVDGTIGTDWSASALVEPNTGPASTWGAANELRAMRVCYDPTNLYLGISGTSEAVNGIVVYIDRDYGSTAGGLPLGVSNFATLTDRAGALDACISANYTLAPSLGFGLEAVFGLRGPQNLNPLATDANVGTRLVFGGSGMPDRRTDFAWVNGTTVRCVSSGTPAMNTCEVSIDWSSIYEASRPANARVALFARINNGTADMTSNQTLPVDNPALPRTISRALVLDVRP